MTSSNRKIRKIEASYTDQIWANFKMAVKAVLNSFATAYQKVICCKTCCQNCKIKRPATVDLTRVVGETEVMVGPEGNYPGTAHK